MKVRYILITLIVLPILLVSLITNGFTIVLNRSDNEITVSIANENEKSKLLSVFGVIFVGFPKIPTHTGHYYISCNNSDKFTELGYVISDSSNWEEVREEDLSC